MITRRRTIAGAIALSPALQFMHASSAFAQYTDILSDDDLISLLENSAWASVGNNQSRIVYVLAAPWCPICLAMHRQIASYTGKLQFRWIMGLARTPENKRQDELIAYTRDYNALNGVYGNALLNAPTPPDARWMAQWNEGVFRVASPTGLAIYNDTRRVRGLPSKNGAGTPIIIWKSVKYGKLQSLIGAPADGNFGWLLGDVAIDPTQHNAIPAAESMKGQIVSFNEIEPTPLFAPDGIPLPLHAVPFMSAPVVKTVAPTFGARAHAVAIDRSGVRWVEFPLTDTVSGWALLTQTVDENHQTPKL